MLAVITFACHRVFLHFLDPNACRIGDKILASSMTLEIGGGGTESLSEEEESDLSSSESQRFDAYDSPC